MLQVGCEFEMEYRGPRDLASYASDLALPMRDFGLNVHRENQARRKTPRDHPYDTSDFVAVAAVVVAVCVAVAVVVVVVMLL